MDLLCKLMDWLLYGRDLRHEKVKECVSPMCSYRLEIESIQHFVLCCHFHHVERSEVLNSLYDI